MEIDTRKDKSLCQVARCPNRAVAWAGMLAEGLPPGESFISVGLCEKHIEILKKAGKKNSELEAAKKLLNDAGYGIYKTGKV